MLCVFILLLSFSSCLARDRTKCLSLNDEPWMVRPNLIDLYPDECPYKYPVKVWDNNPTEWSSAQYHDVYHYLIKRPRVFSNEAMENYKSLEAYKFFVSG